MVNERLVEIATRSLTRHRGGHRPIEKARLGMYDFCDFDDSHEEIDEAIEVAVKELNKDTSLPRLEDRPRHPGR